MAIGADRPKVIRIGFATGLVLGLIGVCIGWVAMFDHLNRALFPASAIPLLVTLLLPTYGPGDIAGGFDAGFAG